MGLYVKFWKICLSVENSASSSQNAKIEGDKSSDGIS